MRTEQQSLWLYNLSSSSFCSDTGLFTSICNKRIFLSIYVRTETVNNVLSLSLYYVQSVPTNLFKVPLAFTLYYAPIHCCKLLMLMIMFLMVIRFVFSLDIIPILFLCKAYMGFRTSENIV